MTPQGMKRPSPTLCALRTMGLLLAMPALLCAQRLVGPQAQKQGPKAGPPVKRPADKSPQEQLQGPEAPIQGPMTDEKIRKLMNYFPDFPFAKPFAPFRHRINYRLDPDFAKELTEFRKLYLSAGKEAFDSSGRPTCTHPEYQKRLAAITPKLENQGGWFAYIVKDSSNLFQRDLVAFASLFLPNREHAFWILASLVYEPNDAVRRRNLRRAIPFFEKNLTQKFTKEDVERVYPPTPENKARVREGRYKFRVPLIPWVDYLRAPRATDRMLALDFLSIIAKKRPSLGAETLRMSEPWVLSCLASGKAELAESARRYIDNVGAGEEKRCPKDPAAAKSYVAKLIHKLYPDIILQGGLCRIYPGPDRDKLIAIGKALLKSGKYGYKAHQELKGSRSKRVVYGIRLADLPAPLDRLGLSKDDLITTIDGAPIFGPADLKTALDAKLKAKITDLTVEFVTPKGDPRVIRYQLLPSR